MKSTKKSRTSQPTRSKGASRATGVNQQQSFNSTEQPGSSKDQLDEFSTMYASQGLKADNAMWRGFDSFNFQQTADQTSKNFNVVHDLRINNPNHNNPVSSNHLHTGSVHAQFTPNSNFQQHTQFYPESLQPLASTFHNAALWPQQSLTNFSPNSLQHLPDFLRSSSSQSYDTNHDNAAYLVQTPTQGLWPGWSPEGVVMSDQSLPVLTYDPNDGMCSSTDVPSLTFDHSSPEEDFESCELSAESASYSKGFDANQDDQELVGVGLYDSPYHATSFNARYTNQRMGKGLRLEETWQPPDSMTQETCSGPLLAEEITVADGEGDYDLEFVGNLAASGHSVVDYGVEINPAFSIPNETAACLHNNYGFDASFDNCCYNMNSTPHPNGNNHYAGPHSDF